MREMARGKRKGWIKKNRYPSRGNRGNPTAGCSRFVAGGKNRSKTSAPLGQKTHYKKNGHIVRKFEDARLGKVSREKEWGWLMYPLKPKTDKNTTVKSRTKGCMWGKVVRAKKGE